MYSFQYFGKDEECNKIMKTISDDAREVKTLSMLDNTREKEIIPMKIILDTEREIRATNFHGTSRAGKSYIVPQIVFMKYIGKQNFVDVSFPFHQIPDILTSLTKINDENKEYFDHL